MAQRRLLYRSMDSQGLVPPQRPLIVYDGDCSFCRRWVRRWQARTGDAVDYEPYQCAAERFPSIAKERFEEATKLIQPDGQVFSGAQAIFRALAAGEYRPWLRIAYENVRPFAAASDFTYRLISHHRGHADFLDRFLLGKQIAPPTCVFTRWLFLRLLGVIYLIAFLSIFAQVDGLVGSKGILSIQPYLRAFEQQYGSRAHSLLPTLLWYGASDHALHLLCAAGIVLSCLLIVGVLPVFTLIGLWMCYLSMVIGGQIFLGFQWDTLLIETAFLSIFFAPMELLLRRAPWSPPSALALLLLRWLLFRVMFLSGVVKLSSGDESWRGWTALNYHYQTQPLPSPLSWYFHQLPATFQSMSVGVTFFAELLAPLLIFGPRRLRLMAFWIIVIFQALILVSGNFGFFNLLTMLLCLLLVDDPFWPAWMRKNFVSRQKQPALWWPLPLLAPLSVVILIVTSMQIVGSFRAEMHWPRPFTSLYGRVSPYLSINTYGLFANMTTQRPEIIIEGSNDGQTWRAYEFRWKPGDLHRAPRFCVPYMPRLDWQMWFAAMGDPRNNPFVHNLLIRLLQGSPPVLELLGMNPFPDRPPHFVRAVLYDYEFTTPQERKQTGDWWKRDPLGIYCRTISANQLR